jgi:hypothetical protein
MISACCACVLAFSVLVCRLCARYVQSRCCHALPRHAVTLGKLDATLSILDEQVGMLVPDLPVVREDVYECYSAAPSFTFFFQ